MNARRFAFISGLIFLIVGVLQFIPSLSTFPEWLPRLKFEVSYGLFLNLFPVNIINKVVLLLFGIAGVAASRTVYAKEKSVLYARTVFFVMGTAAVLGAMPLTKTVFGYWPLFDGEVVLHGIAAVIGGVFGFSSHAMEVDRHREAHI